MWRHSSWSARSAIFCHCYFLSFFKCDMLYFYNIYFAYVRNFLTPLSEIGLVNTQRASAGNPIAIELRPIIKSLGASARTITHPNFWLFQPKLHSVICRIWLTASWAFLWVKDSMLLTTARNSRAAPAVWGAKKMQLLSIKVSAKPIQKMIFELGREYKIIF